MIDSKSSCAKSNVIAILTCHNRKQKTLGCVESLVMGNPDIHFQFVIVDDKSTDGTVAALEELRGKLENASIHIILGTGELFWSGGMRQGMRYAKNHLISEYVLLVNDDVSFWNNSICNMIEYHIANREKAMILVGATCDNLQKMTYSGIRYLPQGVRYEKVAVNDENRCCDTFNANCVLLPFDTFVSTPSIDDRYIHSLGDFDYGLTLKREGCYIEVFSEFVGECLLNGIENTWRDTSLSRKERLRKKEEVKGAPFSQWFYFLKKNFGMKKALVHSVTPYLRILLKK